MPNTIIPIAHIDDLKVYLPIRAGNDEFNDRLRSVAIMATGQIQQHTRREFDRRERVEVLDSRDNTRRVLDLDGNADTGLETFRTMGTRTQVREQILWLGSLPVDLGETFEVRYAPDRDFSDDGTVVESDAYDVDTEAGKLFLQIGTVRLHRSVQVTYTAGFETVRPLVLTSYSTLDSNDAGANVTVDADDLTATVSAANEGSVVSTHHQSAGKFYVEFTTTTEHVRIGLATPGFDTEQGAGETADSWAFDTLDGMTYVGSVGSAYADHAHAGSIIGVAVDLDNDAAWFSVNGVWQNGATLAEIEAGDTTNAAFDGLLTGMKNLVVGDANGSEATGVTANFGASPFQSEVPEDFVEGWGPAVLSPDYFLKNPPENLKQAFIFQSLFLWKKLDPDNVGARSDRKEGQDATDFLKAAGLTPEAASLLRDYKRLAKGLS